MIDRTSPTAFALTCLQSRRVDQLAVERYGMSGLVLMENAGRGCAELLEELGVHGRVLICCGKGNNGGDGCVIARHLANRGRAVTVWLLTSAAQLIGDAATNYQIWRRMDGETVDVAASSGLPGLPAVEPADWIVDAMLGTGASGPPREPYRSAIRQLNGVSARKLAVDLPSGLNADTGEPGEPTFRADVTATFVAAKAGFAHPLARDYLGDVRVIDIGVPRRVIAEARA